MDYIAQLDLILQRINEPVLSDVEEATIHPLNPADELEKYTILNNILIARGDDADILLKLKQDALIWQSLDLGSSDVLKYASEIIIGAAL